MSSLTIIDGNILDAQEEYILQQCCCTAVKPHGLSEVIAIKWKDCNVYSERRKIGNRNLAVVEDRPKPGTIKVVGERKVICAFAQYAMGKSGRYDSFNIPDTPNDRYNYFKECLDKIVLLNPKSIAIPYKIGCGLAGGDWNKYSSTISEFAQKYQQIKIVIYKL